MATSKSGLVEKWDGRNVSLNSCLERLEEFFILEDVTEDRKQVAALLTYIGSYGYEIFKSLLSPDKPSSRNYADLKNLSQIISHLNQ